MIIAKYPEHIEAQLKILDEKIEEIYRNYASMKFRPDEAVRIKANLHKAIEPFVNEKVRLIQNSVPKYVVTLSGAEEVQNGNQSVSQDI